MIRRGGPTGRPFCIGALQHTSDDGRCRTALIAYEQNMFPGLEAEAELVHDANFAAELIL